MGETVTMTLTEFLLARITEDYDVAMQCALASTATPGPAAGVVERHIERWGPTRVLAECAAKRRIVGLAQEQPATLAEVVATLAEVYADHEDYRDEWKP